MHRRRYAATSSVHLLNARLPRAAIQPDPADEATFTLLNLLTETIERDRYPFLHRVRTPRDILAKFGRMSPAPHRPGHRDQTVDEGCTDRDGLAILSLPKEVTASPWYLCDLLSMSGTPAHNALFRRLPGGALGQPKWTIKKPTTAASGGLRPSHLRRRGCRCDRLSRHTPRPRNPNRRRLL